jgi:hypothetical protein
MRTGLTALRTLLAMPFALLLALGPASANEVVYPPGSRVGLVPLQGIVPLKRGAGFENPDNNLIISLQELPRSTYQTIEAAVRDRKPLPTAMENAEVLETASGKAYLSRAGGPNSGPKNNRTAIMVSDGKITAYVAVDVPEAAAKTYSQQAIRQMLASTTFRSEVPGEEQLALMPFKVSELSGFTRVRTLVPGLAVMLLDGEVEATLSGAPYILIQVAPVSADQPDERERLARQLARQITQTIPIRDATPTLAEPMRIGGIAGHEMRIEAVSIKDDRKVNVVQWLRYGSGATLRILAAAPREDWPAMFARFRAVRDGIDRR